jgi:hypothetical protein
MDALDIPASLRHDIEATSPTAATLPSRERMAATRAGSRSMTKVS